MRSLLNNDDGIEISRADAAYVTRVPDDRLRKWYSFYDLVASPRTFRSDLLRVTLIEHMRARAVPVRIAIAAVSTERVTRPLAHIDKIFPKILRAEARYFLAVIFDADGEVADAFISGPPKSGEAHQDVPLRGHLMTFDLEPILTGVECRLAEIDKDSYRRRRDQVRKGGRR